MTAAALTMHARGVWFSASVLLLLEDKVIERDWVDSMIANFGFALDRLEEYIGKGNARYLLLVILALILLILARRRR